MNFILTGHKGLIGSFLLKRLKRDGHKGVHYIDLRAGNDIRAMSAYDGSKADILFHLAAHCSIRDSIVNPSLVFEHNVRGTYEVLEFCRLNEIPKIVLTSSTRVLYPEKNPYTASKIYCEELVKAYSQCYGIDYVIVRPSTVYGPFDDKTGRLVDKWMRAALSGEPLKIFGNAEKRLDFTYVSDFIDGLLLAAEQKNQDYDIATGWGMDLATAAEYIVKIAGSKSSVEFHDAELAQPQDVSIDISKIRKLGYQPRVSFTEGMKRTLEFYKCLKAN